MTDLSEDQEVWSLLKPIFEDQETTVKTLRKSSYEVSAGTNIKYKTEKCRYWSIYQNCPFGQSCAFAHGDSEIRQKLHTSANYKTKLCSNFSKTGVCKYGDRCQFKHQTRQPALKVPKQAIQYSQFLQELPQKFGEPLPIKRLRLFEEFEEDEFQKINWKYKKPRTYTI